MDAALIDLASQQFLGQWKRLVSTTNWEKGQIIHGWREALRATAALASEFSDEAWSRRVGNVTPQHVGRLRRVFERFFQVRDEYPGLFWSHFQAAIDWDDAEMWLEGAVHSDWSVSEMRHQRWEATGGAVEAEPPLDDATLEGPWDEDADRQGVAAEVVTGTMGVVQAPERTVDDEVETEEGYDHAQFHDEAGDEVGSPQDHGPTEQEWVRPFASLPPLVPDINDAFEAFKLAILRHKLAGWRDISRDDVLLTLDSLKQLVLAPAEA